MWCSGSGEGCGGGPPSRGSETQALLGSAPRESADKVVLHTGKYEELIVCSHEIAASTAQLVAASKVRLPSGSWAPSRGGGTTCGGETVGVGVVQPAGRPAP